MKYKFILIVDDETLARNKLRRLIVEHASPERIAEAANGQQALQIILRELPDLIFLDMEMPEMSGLALLAKLRQHLPKLPPVVFVTAYDQFALPAFEADAHDFLLKPYDEIRFLRSLKKLGLHQAGSASDLDKLVLQERGQMLVIALNEIEAVEAADNYIYIHTASSTHLHRNSLQGIQQKLGTHFLRCHRRYLVNLNQIKRLQMSANATALCELKSGREVPVSRQYKAEFQQALLTINPGT